MQSYYFNGSTKTIELQNTSSFEAQDLYSRWKDWVLVGDNAKYEQAFRIVGGDPITATKSLGITYFLTNNWKIQPTASNHTIDINGNLYGETTLQAGTVVDPISPASGSFNVLVRLNVSNLVDAEVLQSAFQQSLEYGGVVYLNANSGTSGSAYPYGTIAQPVNNMAQAVQIANAYGFTDIIMLSSATASANLSGKHVSGHTRAIQLYLRADEGYDYADTSFSELSIYGTSTGSVYIDDAIINGVQRLCGVVTDTGLTGSISLDSHCNATFHQCYSKVAGTASPIIYCSGSGISMNMRAYSGGLRLSDITDSDFVATVEFIAGKLTMVPSDVAGLVSVRGVANLNDSANGGTTLETGSLLDPTRMGNNSYAIAGKVGDLHRIHGLEGGTPLVVTPTSRTAGAVTQSISTGGGGEVTVTRS